MHLNDITKRIVRTDRIIEAQKEEDPVLLTIVVETRTGNLLETLTFHTEKDRNIAYDQVNAAVAFMERRFERTTR